MAREYFAAISLLEALIINPSSCSVPASSAVAASGCR
jgi:hypothetical protein